MSKLQGTSIHWFWGDANVAEFADNIHEKIMAGNGNIGDVLGVIDLEAFQHCKEGFVFTRDRLYFRQFAGYGCCYKWRDIIDFTLDGTKLMINGTPLDNITHSKDEAMRVFKIVQAILNRAELTPENPPVDETIERSMGELAYQAFLRVDKGDRIYLGENIPAEKRTNAYQAFGVKEPATAILVLMDSSFFGSGKEGAVITNRAIYSNSGRIPWDAFTFAMRHGTDIMLHSAVGDAIIKLGCSLFGKQDAICDALNSLSEMKTKEWQRCTDARELLEKRMKLEKAERYTGKTLADFENEESFIKAGDDAERKYFSESTVKAAVGQNAKDGFRVLEDNAPAAGTWKIDGGRYYLDKPIRLCDATRLYIANAEIYFGKNGWFELNGGEGTFWNCRFVGADKVEHGDSACGAYMFTGKSSGAFFEQCEFNGDGNRAAMLMDGNVSIMHSKFINLYSNRNGGAIVGSRYDKNDRTSKISINLCSFEDCKSENLSIFWARQAFVVDSEFVACVARWSMITVVEDSE